MALLSSLLYNNLRTNTCQCTLAILSVLFLLFTFRIIYNLFFSPLARIPGPFWARITDLWHVRLIRTCSEHSALHDLHARYGPLVRIGPSKLSVTDATAFRKIYNVAAPFPKTDYYQPFRVPGPKVDIFVEKNESVHGKLRRQYSNLYSATGLRELDGNVDDSIRNFIAQIRKTEGKNIDLGKWFKRLMFDCMCDMTFGQNQDYIGSCSEDEPFYALAQFLQRAHLYGMTPALFYVSKATKFITGKFFPQANTPAGVDQTMETLFQALKDTNSTKQGPNQRNLASRLLAVQSTKGSEIFADEELAHIIDFGLKAGGTDGGALLNSIFYHLIHNRDKLDKLMQELHQHLNDRKLDIVCTSQQAAACSYLNAVIQESLRMLPSIGGILPREVPKGGAGILGHHVPAGVTIGAPAYAMHRLPEVFGPESTSFVPERWLERGQPNMCKFLSEYYGSLRRLTS
ncbi:hypothetical protein COCCADRAFT_84517 [Bipolaris zeicola 26-R-13]|uniref:Cytochrome P450 n=1 Tax=Cochliobolus carbonum (strain 26-R-13) TaxID=930089 RepID=W6YEC0_COCC2|nr:uncharacterized protein COCCADRAFT_84517 [Bipolaris zeicola 26-R-13]EUC37827.1 hypothetical protein COCCADRAFT_84517 [Bipolaris zeicola 26-R-13]